MKAILACVDFSEVTSPVVEAATAAAAAHWARLYLVHVLNYTQTGIGFETVPIINPEPGEAAREARARIEGLREPLKEAGVDVSTMLVETVMPPATAILREAERLGAELIVIGTHGHGVLYRALIGSVAEGVLRKSEVPVLLVPARVGAELPLPVHDEHHRCDHSDGRPCAGGGACGRHERREPVTARTP